MAEPMVLPYKVSEVARKLGMSESFVRKEIREGRLRAAHKRNESRTWYVKQEWLDEWAEGGMLEAPNERKSA